MFSLTKSQLQEKAAGLGFVRDTLEKVYRLVDILEFINLNNTIKYRLALKGGTAINLLHFNLLRLSVDIDLDYCGFCNKDEMLFDRSSIDSAIKDYMKSNNYVLSPKSKFYHALDSYIYSYTNLAGNIDNIKIEINYLNRLHIFEPRMFSLIDCLSDTKVYALDAVELFASKIVALISRATPRDLYDVYNFLNSKLYTRVDAGLLRKTLILYGFLNSMDLRNISLLVQSVDHITAYQVKCNLIPVLNKKESFDVDVAKKDCLSKIKKLLVLNDSEVDFLNCAFERGTFCPELLFDNDEIAGRLKFHPAAEWRIKQLSVR